MSIREALNRIPPAVTIAVVAVIVVAVGIYIYSQFGPTTITPMAPAAEGEKTTLKCAACGYTFEKETRELQGRYGYPDGSIVLSDEGLRCPKCNRYKVAIAGAPRR